jgi:hypothetical protein
MYLLYIMRITEENNLKIYPTKQSIDKPLGLPHPFADKNSCYVVTGGQGSGKSTFVCSALTNRQKDGKIFSGCFERVFYATPYECFTSEEDHPFKNHVKSRLFHEFNSDMLNNVVQQALEIKHENQGNSILVIDDFSEELKNKDTILLLKKKINKHRHYHLSVIISALTMKSIPKTIRGLIDYYVIFKPKGLIELEGFSEEIMALNKKDMMDVMDFVYDSDHNFLMYNNKKGWWYKNFSKFSIKDV